MRVLPIPDGLDFPYAEQAIVIERYVMVRKSGRWVMRNCEAVLYVTSLAAEASTPRDLLAHVRGHWTVGARAPGFLQGQDGLSCSGRSFHQSPGIYAV